MIENSLKKTVIEQSSTKSQMSEVSKVLLLKGGVYYAASEQER